MSRFTFYATLDADSIYPAVHAAMPPVPVMLVASSFARKGLRKPTLPEHLPEKAADCGGFVATLKWGDYRYTPAQYVAWLRTWRPAWAATFDYCCEPEIDGVVADRQRRTTEMAHHFWDEYRDEPWCWVPTVQGWEVADYRRHAQELAPLVSEMAAHYGPGSAFRVGIGTLCRRASSGMVRDVVAAVRDVLPDVGLHLWGVKITLFKSEGGLPPGVVSTDSAAWNGLTGASGYDRWRQSGLKQRQYSYLVALPEYLDKVREALTAPRTLPMFCGRAA